MASSASHHRRRLAVLLGRSSTALCSGGSLALFVILLTWYNDREERLPNTAEDSCAYKYLPIAGTAYSIVWSLFCLVTYGMRSARWLPGRVKLWADVIGAVELAVLGYVGFIHDVLYDWRVPGNVPMSERRIQVIAVTLLSLSGASHLIFFCYGCTGDLDEPQRPASPLDSWQGDKLQLNNNKYSPTDASTVDGESVGASHGGRNNFPAPSYDNSPALPPLPSPVLGRGPFSQNSRPYPMARPLLPPPPPSTYSSAEPHPLDLVPQYTPPSYGANPINHFDDMFEDQRLLSPRAAPPLPTERKRPRVSIEPFPVTINPPSAPNSARPSSRTSDATASGSAATTPTVRHGRSASAVSRLASLKLKPIQRPRAASTPAQLAPSGDAPNYLPGGYVTNLERPRETQPAVTRDEQAAVPQEADRKGYYG